MTRWTLTRRLAQVDNLDFLQIIEMSARPYRNLRRCVALVQLVVRVDVNVTYCGLALELNVD